MKDFRESDLYDFQDPGEITKKITDMARRKGFPTGRGWEKNPDIANNTVRNYLGEKNADDIVRHCEQKEHPVVVEIGFGQANALAELKERHSNIFPIGIDLYIQKEAKEKKKDGKLCLVQGHAEQIPLADESVDILYTAMAYRYFIDKLKFISEVVRVLKPDGVAYIELGEQRHCYTIPSLEKIIDKAGLSKILVIDKFRIFFPDPYDADSTIGTDQRILRIEKAKMSVEIDWKAEFQRCSYGGTYTESFYELK